MRSFGSWLPAQQLLNFVVPLDDAQESNSDIHSPKINLQARPGCFPAKRTNEMQSASDWLVLSDDNVRKKTNLFDLSQRHFQLVRHCRVHSPTIEQYVLDN